MYYGHGIPHSIYDLDIEGFYKCRRCGCSSYSSDYLHRLFYDHNHWCFGIYCRRCWLQLPLRERLTGYKDYLDHSMSSSIENRWWPNVAQQIWKEWLNPDANAELEHRASIQCQIASYSYPVFENLFSSL